MRPSLVVDALTAPPRKSSTMDGPHTSPAFADRASPTTYFIADEATLEAAAAMKASTSSASSAHMLQGSATYGVHSLPDTEGEVSSVLEPKGRGRPDLTDAAEGLKSRHRHDAYPGYSAAEPLLNPRVSELLASSTASSAASSSCIRPESRSPPQQESRRSPPFSATAPSPPPLFASPMPGSSFPCSPMSMSGKSMRHDDSDSILDEVASQAVTSSDEDESRSPADAQSAAPQLIMPSIKMPSRRPFTERGKAMGRLKVLVAGLTGTGKTSLIKSIVQACDDIVHVDPLSSSAPTIHTVGSKRPSSRRQRPASSSTREITEVYASTKPYPSWWSDFDESRVLRRRRSYGDSVLERNLCFVDTPGYSKELSTSSEVIEKIVHYVEAQFQHVSSFDQMRTGDVINILSGNGAPLVDAVIILLSHKLRSSDIELIRRLSPLTNVIPLISKQDLLTPEKTAALKASVLQKFLALDIQPFLFGKSVDEILQSDNTAPPFAVSSATAIDSDNMDASILMSPDYVQPLVPSELKQLIDFVFERNRMAWLRHSAAKKYARWRGSGGRRAPHADAGAGALAPAPYFLAGGAASSSASAGVAGSVSSASHTSNASSSRAASSSSRVLLPPVGATSSYAVARLADHRQREEKLAQVQLAKWASDLQRSLQNERERFEALARGERAVWLTQRLGECVAEGTLVPLAAEGTAAAAAALSRRAGSGRIASNLFAPDVVPPSSIKRWTVDDPRDPLGLLRYNAQLREKGLLVLRVVGSLSIVGGLAIWIVRHWNLALSEDLARWRWNC